MSVSSMAGAPSTLSFILAATMMMAMASTPEAGEERDADFLPDQPRAMYIKNDLEGGLPMAVMCYLNKRPIWDRPRKLKPGQSVALYPDDWNVYDYLCYECGVWAPFLKKWCTFRAYDTLLHVEDCMGYGCKWLFKMDSIYFGVMQDKQKKYTGGPFRKAGRWCS